MFSIRRPTPQRAERFMQRQTGLPLSYAAIGATANKPPEGYVVDHTRVKLGEGEAVFEAAKSALERWDQFNLGWVQTWSPAGPIQLGCPVSVAGRSLGVWWSNACEVVYVVDERSDFFARFGFAYGTLPGHAKTGEERFLVEWNRTTGEVWYDVLAFSNPRHWIAKIADRWIRKLQKRFGPESAEAMRRAVARELKPLR
jgi:uncharacterized protein (UPF0548 family)